MKKAVLALTLTLTLSLAACGRGEGLSSSPASSGPEQPVRIEMPVREYPETGPVQTVEIPLLAGTAPGLDTANTPFRHLLEERERLLAQGEGELLEIHAYSFPRGDWVQVLTTSVNRGENGELAVESANYDVGSGAFVTPREALERLSLTAEELEDRLAAQQLQPEEAETRLQHLWQPQAFLVREDGSMVFFFLAEYSVVGDPDTPGPRPVVSYDSGTGAFSLTPPGLLLAAEAAKEPTPPGTSAPPPRS